MPGKDRKQLTKDFYASFSSGDREAVEAILAEDLSFHAPPDPDLDRAGWFERCWPHAGSGDRFEFPRLVEDGDEVLVTYESGKSDGRRIRNTEVLTFDAEDRVREVEVYFGWNL
jgi:ketosteroid isomerase-like protein